MAKEIVLRKRNRDADRVCTSMRITNPAYRFTFDTCENVEAIITNKNGEILEILNSDAPSATISDAGVYNICIEGDGLGVLYAEWTKKEDPENCCDELRQKDTELQNQINGVSGRLQTAEEKIDQFDDTNTVTTLSAGSNIGITDSGTDGNHAYTVSVNTDPSFNSVNGLSNTTFTPTSITSGRAATEDQVKAALQFGETREGGLYRSKEFSDTIVGKNSITLSQKDSTINNGLSSILLQVDTTDYYITLKEDAQPNTLAYVFSISESKLSDSISLTDVVKYPIFYEKNTRSSLREFYISVKLPKEDEENSFIDEEGLPRYKNDRNDTKASAINTEIEIEIDEDNDLFILHCENTVNPDFVINKGTKFRIFHGINMSHGSIVNRGVNYNPDSILFGKENVNIGYENILFGLGNLSSGFRSITGGLKNTNELHNSFVGGAYNKNYGGNSLLVGNNNINNNNNNIIAGGSNINNGNSCIIAGGSNENTVHTSIVGGSGNKNLQGENDGGRNSIILGETNVNKGRASALFGICHNNIIDYALLCGRGHDTSNLDDPVSVNDSGIFACGTYAEITNDIKMVVGGGVSEEIRRNLFAVNKNGTATVMKNPVNEMDVATKQYVDALLTRITALEARVAVLENP